MPREGTKFHITLRWRRLPGGFKRHTFACGVDDSGLPVLSPAQGLDGRFDPNVCVRCKTKAAALNGGTPEQFILAR